MWTFLFILTIFCLHFGHLILCGTCVAGCSFVSHFFSFVCCAFFPVLFTLSFSTFQRERRITERGNFSLVSHFINTLFMAMQSFSLQKYKACAVGYFVQILPVFPFDHFVSAFDRRLFHLNLRYRPSAVIFDSKPFQIGNVRKYCLFDCAGCVCWEARFLHMQSTPFTGCSEVSQSGLYIEIDERWRNIHSNLYFMAGDSDSMRSEPWKNCIGILYL